MKKQFFRMMLMLLTMGLMFVACKKDKVNSSVDGRISKIYCTTTSDAGTNRWLSEKWYWATNGNLIRIEHFNNDGTVQYNMGFVYTGQVLTRVNYNSGDFYAELQHENGKLKGIRNYANGSLRDIYTFTYENGELRTIVLQNNGDVTSKTADMPFSMLRFVLPEQAWRFVETSMGKRQLATQAKSAYSVTITLTWNSGNISRMDYLEAMEGANAVHRWEEMQYDSFNNPFYTRYNGELNVVNYFSKNNMRSLVSNYDAQTSYHQNFEYTYENKYPKTQKITTEGSTYVLTYEFEYQ